MDHGGTKKKFFFSTKRPDFFRKFKEASFLAFVENHEASELRKLYMLLLSDP